MTILNIVMATILVVVMVLLAFSYKLQRMIKIGLEQAAGARPYERPLKRATARLLIIGDSSAVGVGTAPETSIAGRLAADFPTLEIRNLAKNGSHLRGANRQLRRLTSDEHFDIILIQAGANDVVGGTPYPKLERRLIRLLHRAKRHTTHVVHLMSGDVATAPIIPVTMRWYFSRRYHEVRELFLKIHAAKGTTYIDLYRDWSQDPLAHKPYSYYSPDGMHPSTLGYAYWYSIIKPMIVSKLPRQ